MTLACEDANSRFVTDANVDDEDRVGNSLMYTWELMLGNTAIFFLIDVFPNLQQTVANTILIINISNSNNLNKFWVGIFTRQGHINKVY